MTWLETVAAQRVAAGLRRTLRERRAGDDALDLAGNDYLGLSRHPDVVAAGIEALRTWGAGATGSRLVTGTTTAHVDCESALAAFAGWPRGLVFSSGYLANLAAVTALSGRDALVVSDAYVHASLVDACRLSRARVVVVPHASVAAVEAALADRSEERALVLTESVYSVDGDLAPLRALHDASRRYGATLVVDEAHAFGVVGPGGRGAVYAAGLAGEPDVVVTVTLSKALGGQGGAVLASAPVVDHLVDSARPFIFDTGLAPTSVAAAAAALRVLEHAPKLAGSARDAARRLASLATSRGLDVTVPDAAVVAVRIGSPAEAVRAGETLRAHGVRAGVFRPPSVPDGVSRLRLTGRADLTDADLDRVDRALAALGGVSQRLAVASGVQDGASQGGGGADSGTIGDDDNAARRRAGRRAAGRGVGRHPL